MQIESEPVCPDMMQSQYQAGVRLSFGFSRSRRGTLIQDSMRLMMLFDNFSYSRTRLSPLCGAFGCRDNGHFLACETKEWAKTPPQSRLNPSFSGICSARAVFLAAVNNGRKS